MDGPRVTAILALVAVLAGGRLWAAPPAPGCAKIVAVLDANPGISAEEVANKTSTDIETVRSCTDAWRAGMEDGTAAPKGGAGTSSMPPGCAKIVDVLDQNPNISADEVAKKTSSDVETVRSCTDLWRRTMKQ
jgi:hypothetical protein